MKTTITKASKIVAAIKRDEPHITLGEFNSRIDAAPLADYAMWVEVEKQVTAWIRGSLAAYRALTADVEAIEQAERPLHADYVYLTDEAIDHENITEGSSMTRESIGYWAHMLGAAGPAIGARAEGYDIDINARLGRVIY